MVSGILEGRFGVRFICVACFVASCAMACGSDTNDAGAVAADLTGDVQGELPGALDAAEVGASDAFDAATNTDVSDAADLATDVVTELEEIDVTSPDALTWIDAAPADVADDAADAGDLDVASPPDVATDVMEAMDLTTTGADMTTPDTGTSPASKYPLGFVMDLYGKVNVINLSSMTKLAQFGEGMHMVHGTPVLPGQKSVWYSDNAMNGKAYIQRYDMLGAPAAWVKAKTVQSPVPISQTSGARNGSVIVTSPGGGIPFMGLSKPGVPEAVGVYLEAVDKFWTLPIATPGPTIVDSTGKKAYVVSYKTHTIHVIDMQGPQFVDTWQVPTAGSDPAWLGPSRVALSQDDAMLVSADSYDSKVSLFSTETGALMSTAPLGQIVYWADFSKDGTLVYTLSWASLPEEGKEVTNCLIKHTISAVEVATGKVVKTGNWEYQLAHISVHPDGNALYASGCFGTLIRFKLPELEMTGVLPLGGGEPMPLMTVDY